jgi:hypothetical protein
VVEDREHLFPHGTRHRFILEERDELADHRISRYVRPEPLRWEAGRVEEAVCLGHAQTQRLCQIEGLPASSGEALIAFQPVNGADVDAGYAGKSILR